MVKTVPLKVGPIWCSETSVTNYQSTLRDSPEKRRPHLHRGWSVRCNMTAVYVWGHLFSKKLDIVRRNSGNYLIYIFQLRIFLTRKLNEQSNWDLEEIPLPGIFFKFSNTFKISASRSCFWTFRVCPSVRPSVFHHKYNCSFQILMKLGMDIMLWHEDIGNHNNTIMTNVRICEVGKLLACFIAFNFWNVEC